VRRGEFRVLMKRVLMKGGAPRVNRTGEGLLFNSCRTVFFEVHDNFG
jgi:hypothetical protein